MEKLDKKKVLAIVLVVALVASLVGTVSLFYNSIDMFLHSAIRAASYEKSQLPYAIIILFAFIAAAFGTAGGIISFVAKNEKLKKLSVIFSLCAVAALFILTVASAGVFLSHECNKSLNYSIPFEVSGDPEYVIYSGVMAAMLQQLVYAAIIAAVLLIAFIMDKKSKKAQIEQNAEIEN